jgi:hypothetical protein
MKGISRMLSLPPALLALIVICTPIASAEADSPYGLPAHLKYFPEDGPLIKRGLEAMEQLGKMTPARAHKISDHEDEMFFLDYWQFEEQDELQHLIARRSDPAQYANQTLDRNLLPPLLVHSDSTAQSALHDRLPVFARDLFKRFTCPAGTFGCNSINRPNSCCGTGEVCISVQDTGLGDVGCCPQGQTCNGMITQCDTAAGYKSCPGFSGGGCCIPNFDCSGIGCKSA